MQFQKKGRMSKAKIYLKRMTTLVIDILIFPIVLIFAIPVALSMLGAEFATKHF